ncbi:MAG: cytochrome c [Alphaproteobacteria bacterium]
MPVTRKLTPIALVLAIVGATILAQAPLIAQRAQPDTADPPKSAAPPPATSSQPPGEGLDIMQRICTPCHSIDFVTATGRDRASWNDTVQEMVNRGASATPEEIDEIVAYLATNFPAKKD